MLETLHTILSLIAAVWNVEDLDRLSKITNRLSRISSRCWCCACEIQDFHGQVTAKCEILTILGEFFFGDKDNDIHMDHLSFETAISA